MNLDQVAIDAAVAQSEDIFRERVRAELVHFISTDQLVKAEINRQVERQMKQYKQQLAAAVNEAYNNSIFPNPTF